MGFTKEQYKAFISTFLAEGKMKKEKMFDTVEEEVVYALKNSEIENYASLSEEDYKRIIQMVKNGENCYTWKYSKDWKRRLWGKFSKTLELQKIKRKIIHRLERIIEKIKNLDEYDVKEFYWATGRLLKKIGSWIFKFIFNDNTEKLILHQMIKYKNTLQNRLNQAFKDDNQVEILKLTMKEEEGDIPCLTFSEHFAFGFTSLSLKKKALFLIVSWCVGYLVLVCSLFVRTPYIFYAYIVLLALFVAANSGQVQREIRTFIAENPWFVDLFWMDLRDEKTIKNTFYEFYYYEPEESTEPSLVPTTSSVPVVEGKGSVEQQVSVCNPYAHKWEEFFQKVLKRHIEGFKVPEYIPLKTTEIHVFDIPTLSADELERNSELMENFIGEKIYKIYRDYNSEIGKIGVEFETVELPEIVPLSSVPFKGETEIVIGRSIKEWITWDVEVSPHALVVGATGGGKSVTINSLINEMVKKEWLLFFVDFKGGMEFGLYKEKHYEVITERENFAEFTDRLIGEIEYRSRLCAEYRAKKLTGLNKKLRKENKKNLPRIVVFLDEYADVNSVKDDFSSSINSNIGKVLAKGRAVGIHLVIGTQRPDADTIGSGAFRDNIACRIIGKMSSESGWAMSLGVSNLSKEEKTFVNKIPEDERKQGMFVVKGTGTMDGKVIVRTPFADDEEFENMVLCDWRDNPYSDYRLHLENEKSDIDMDIDDLSKPPTKKTPKEKEIDPLELM